MTDETIIKLAPNAFIYLFFKRAGMLLVVFLFFFLLFMVSRHDHAQNSTSSTTNSNQAQTSSHLIINGHPATPEETAKFHKGLEWVGGGVLLLLLMPVLFGQMIYIYFLVRSYQIKVHKDGLGLQYGVFNLRNELLLYTKIQDIVLTRNILERIFGLSTLLIQNAMGSPEYLPGLATSAAEELQSMVRDRIAHSSRAAS